ncbi:MAG: AAA family ATPase [Clostridium sp.]|nr:AAA family ATPase [Clostridium sp.]
MTLTAKQEEGLKIAVERYYAHERWTCIAGYAGSGKSTLIKFIISALDVDPEEEVCYVAFTGKAATVLQQKGCPNATTAHKLLYKAKMMSNGTFKFFPKDNSELAQYKVIVVDEISMLPKKLWDLMLTHGIYIIAAGDPGQLPPVDPNENNHVLDKPHIFLDEIMRQAQDSEIIRFSMWIREGKSLISYRPEGKQVRVYDKSQVIPEMYDWAD